MGNNVVLGVSGVCSMFGFTLGGVDKALLLEIFDVDIQQTAKAHTIVKDFARPGGMSMYFEHLLVTCYDGGNATHINNGLPDVIDIKLFASQQENDFVAKFFLDRHPTLFGGRLWGGGWRRQGS